MSQSYNKAPLMSQKMSQMDTKMVTKKGVERDVTIDRFRGATVIGMIFFQLLHHFTNLGWWTRFSIHAQAVNKTLGYYIMPNITIADVIMPQFAICIGLTSFQSFRRRAASGKESLSSAYLSAVSRALNLLGVGVLTRAVAQIILDTDHTSEVVPKALRIYRESAEYLMYAMICVIALLLLVVFVPNCVLRICNKESKGSVLSIVQRAVKITGKVVFGISGLYNIVLDIWWMCAIWKSESLDGHGYWLALQTFGSASLIVVLFLNRGIAVRLIAAAVILITYGIFTELTLSGAHHSNRALLDVPPDAGFFGSLNYVALILLASVYQDVRTTGWWGNWTTNPTSTIDKTEVERTSTNVLSEPDVQDYLASTVIPIDDGPSKQSLPLSSQLKTYLLRPKSSPADQGLAFVIILVAVAVVVGVTSLLGMKGFTGESSVIQTTKPIASTSFILCSLGWGLLVFQIFKLFENFNRKLRCDFLMWYGRNPILFFLLEFSAIGLYTEFAGDWLDASAGYAVLQVAGIMGVLTLLGWSLHHYRIILKL